MLLIELYLFWTWNIPLTSLQSVFSLMYVVTCLTLFWPVFRNLLGNLQLKQQIVAVHRPADTESVLSTHIYKHSKHLCVPSGITVFQSYQDTEVISGLESKGLKYVNLGLKSHKIHKYLSWWAKHGRYNSHSLESQQCPNTSPTSVLNSQSNLLRIIPAKNTLYH